MSARILVIGAGLGGLTAALALNKAGFAVEEHDQVAALSEVGAGLTLSRGAQHVFRSIGVQDRLAPFATPATAFPFLHYRSGGLLSGKITSAEGRPDDGRADVPRQCHRADLHTVLTNAFNERVPEGLKLGHRLAAIEEPAGRIRTVFANGHTADADAVILADGVRSAGRTILWGLGSARFTGQIAYRFLVDRATAAPILQFGRGAVFLGPRLTFNRYTIRGGEILNCVAIAATDCWTDDGWSTPASRDELLARCPGWHSEVIQLIANAGSSIKWGLFDRAPLNRWSLGLATLLGDAAHPMLPFLGMGAAMAIEDAIVLARSFSTESSVETAFARYETARRPRTALLHAKSIEQGRLVQSLDPDRYDARAAPASDPSILNYDPVTAPI